MSRKAASRSGIPVWLTRTAFPKRRGGLVWTGLSLLPTRRSARTLCDVCEAVIGAIFIAAGCEQAVEFVNEHWKELIDKNVAPPKDAKTLLQETAHNLGLGVPQYRLVSREGSEHEPLFHMEVVFPGGTAEAGSGRNKKLAEQEAAAKMLAKLGIKNG